MVFPIQILTKIRQRRWLLLGTFAVLFSLVVAGGILPARLLGSGDQQEPAEQIRVLQVTTSPLEKKSGYSRQRVYLGRVEPQRSSRLGFEVAGMLKRIHVREGQVVQGGQLLAELDTQRLQAARKETEALLLEAEAAYTLARATLERTRQAHRLKAVSIQQLDEATSSLASRQASVVRVKAQLDRIDVDLQKSVLRSPYDGTIATQSFDEGTVIGAGQTVMELVETAANEILVGIDRDVFADLKEDAVLSATIDHHPVTLAIDRVLPGRQPTSRTVQVIAIPVTAEVPLREGDLLEIAVDQPVEEEGFWLPVSALTENARGIWSCLIAEPLEKQALPGEASHLLVRRDIQILAVENTRVYATGNLDSGDQLVIDGVHRVVPNQRVSLKGEKAVSSSRLNILQQYGSL